MTKLRTGTSKLPMLFIALVVLSGFQADWQRLRRSSSFARPANGDR